MSGLHAAEKSVAASASNIANMRNQIRTEDAKLRAGADNAPPDPEAFRPVRVTQHSVEPAGVKAEYSEADPPHVLSFDPSSPVADADGLVAVPDVNVEDELVNLIRAQRAYEANLQPIKAEDEMMGELLDTKT